MLIGYHAVFDGSFEEAISFAAGHGFGYVQFDLNVPRFFLDGLSPADRDRIGRAAADNGVGLGFHAPGDNVSLFTDFPLIREGLLRQMELIIQRAGEMGARHVTVHPGSPPSFRKAAEKDDAYRLEHRAYYGTVFRENLRRLAERAGAVLLCVENSGWMEGAFDVLPEMLAEDAAVNLCWDFAKSSLQPAEEGFFRAHAARIREVHVHDVDPRGRQHLALGSGVLDFRRYADLIGRADVATTIEVRPREAAVESRDRLLRLLAAKEAS